jgi:Fibronectin type III domain
MFTRAPAPVLLQLGPAESRRVGRYRILSEQNLNKEITMRRSAYIAVLLMLIVSVAVEAQSGCCSSHGGVCGCRCCDGTRLSDICAPHFPTCGGSAPLAPSGLSGLAQSAHQIFLVWIDNSSTETSFRIERRTASTSYREVLSVAANVKSAIITGLSPSTTYFFRIRAHNSSGSSVSSEFTVTTLDEGETLCDPPAACFAGNRFQVTARWQTPNGDAGDATVLRLTDDSGYLWFFNPSNVEAVFKVINACNLNQRFWFFAGGLTNVQTTITVLDTKTGAKKEYRNPQSTAFRPLQDTAAFATCP